MNSKKTDVLLDKLIRLHIQTGMQPTIKLKNADIDGKKYDVEITIKVSPTHH